MKTIAPLAQGVEEFENLWIPLPDGCHLAARLWRPEAASAQPVPAIVEYIPYRKRDIKRIRDSRMHAYFAAQGYASIRVDLRGSGESEGVLTDEYLEQELVDGEHVLAWLRAQPWCNGRIGMIGISWGGFNSLQLAARRPPGLASIIAVCASDDRYADDVHYMGGCLLNDNVSWGAAMFAFNSMPPDPAIVGERWHSMWLERLRHIRPWAANWMAHPRRDGYWRHGSVCEDYSAIACPVMVVSGWADGYSNAVFRLVEHLQAPCKGLVGPWSHVYPHRGTPGPEIGFLQTAVEWWDHWLADRPNQAMAGPQLQVWMQENLPPQADYSHRPGRWVGEAEWPSPHLQWTDFTLRRGCLVPTASAVTADSTTWDETIAVRSPLSVGLFAGKWCSFGGAPDMPYDQREEDGGSAVFDSDPLPERLEILGAPELELELSADQPVAMIAVRLSDLALDDKASRVTYGLLNLCHREDHNELSALEPGRRYRVKVALNHIAHAFPAGHRLRISVSTSYWPLAWVPPRPVRLTLFPGRSRLSLPVRPPRPVEDDQIAVFTVPESAQPAAHTVVRPPDQNWFITRDLAQEQSTLHVRNDEGEWRLDEIDLTIERMTEEWYRFRGDEFTSAEAEIRTERRLRRADWEVRIDTRTLLTCDTVNFYLHATLDAWEGERRVFSETWNETIPRDFR